MNKNILKILEYMGYTLDENKMIMYDKNHNELKKEKINNEVYDGIVFKTNSGESIHFDESGFMKLSLDDETTIMAHNLYNEHNYDSLVIYYGSSVLHPELTLFFDVVKREKSTENNCIFVSMYENTMYVEEDNYFEEMLGIIENEDGADISLFNKVVRHIDINECTRDKYLDIIVKFINNIDDEKLKNDVVRGFKIVLPALVPMIDEMINNRELSNKRKH